MQLVGSHPEAALFPIKSFQVEVKVSEPAELKAKVGLVGTGVLAAK